MDNLQIPAPPAFLFENATGSTEILNEGTPTFLLDRIDVSNGIQVYIQGAKFPKKGFPYPEAIFAINIAKRMLIEGLKLSPYFVIGIIRPYKTLEKLISAYTEISEKVLKQHYIKDSFLTPLARELGNMIYSFLLKLRMPNEISFRFAKVIQGIFEYDDAYRFRLEDVLSETTKETIANSPRKELKRLLNIFIERQGKDERLKKNAIRLISILNVILLIPRFGESFKQTILESDFTALQYDEADRYWCSMRGDYKYFGTTFEERDVELLPSYRITA